MYKGVPVSLYPSKFNYIIPISNQSYYTAVRHGTIKMTKCITIIR